MVSRFIDKFDRIDDDTLGDSFTVACGNVGIRDESALPIDFSSIVSGVSPILEGLTALKTQAFYTGNSMDGSDYVVRGVWTHDNVTPDGDTDPSFTLLARMSKDPLLEDLGVDEDPLCYDQGYGLRVTCPEDGSAPVLKIIKFQPNRRAPNLSRPSSTEVDGATVLTSVVLASDNLNLDPAWDETGDFPYRGFWQDMRLRVRRADNEVVLEAYLNDRNMNTEILIYEDRADPLWGVIGLPGFEFLSATLTVQPAGVSPFSLMGEAVMRCAIFTVETIKDVRQPVTVQPGNFYTYDEVAKRVIELVEKNGGADYTTTTQGMTKMQVYLEFVLEAEAHIIRKEGYYQWLFRDATINLSDGRDAYDLPEDIGMIEQVFPGNYPGIPLRELTNALFRQRLGGISQTAGKPQVFTVAPQSVNNRKRIRFFPIPTISSISGTSGDNPFVTVEYFARRLRPSDPDMQVPFVPQEHIDVLIYGGAAHALLLDTDPGNAQAFAQVFEGKLADLRRDNNRKGSERQTVAVSAADHIKPNVTSRIPLLRATQLETLLI